MSLCVKALSIKKVNINNVGNNNVKLEKFDVNVRE